MHTHTTRYAFRFLGTFFHFLDHTKLQVLLWLLCYTINHTRNVTKISVFVVLSCMIYQRECLTNNAGFQQSTDFESHTQFQSRFWSFRSRCTYIVELLCIHVSVLACVNVNVRLLSGTTVESKSGWVQRVTGWQSSG